MRIPGVEQPVSADFSENARKHLPGGISILEVSPIAKPDFHGNSEFLGIRLAR